MHRRYIQAKLMLIQTVMSLFFVEFATANSFMNVKNKTTSHSLYLLYTRVDSGEFAHFFFVRYKIVFFKSAG